MDFCGVDNDVKDIFKSDIKLHLGPNSDENTQKITILNPNIKLRELGITSEYYLQLKGTNYNDNIIDYYIIKKIQDNNTIIIDTQNGRKLVNDTDGRKLVNDTDGNELTQPSIQQINNIQITYFKPSSNKSIYKYKKLCEYYICASYRSFLIGHQFLDYSSKHMISKVLYLGCRYIELDIFDKEIKNDTIPVVSGGFEKNRYKLLLNDELFEDCIEVISKFAFSDKFLNNFNDPLFLFLNINTENYNTLNKVAKIIKQYLNRFLLDKKYNHVNIANLTLCDVKRKVVLLSSEGYLNTDLDKLINASTDKPYLRRIPFNEVLYEKSISNEPKVVLNSTLIQFVPDIRDYLLFRDSSINLLILGLKSGDTLQISGASKPKNNSGQFLFKIYQVTKNKIVFDKAVNLVIENVGSPIVIKGYDKNMGKANLQTYNKENITIVIPDKQMFSNNVNYKTAFSKGCQIVAMNFQTFDRYLLEYFDYFQEKSFMKKPRVLINYNYQSKVESLNSMMPKPKLEVNIVIDYDIITKFVNSSSDIIINPYNDDTIRVINDNKIPRISLKYNNDNSIFNLKKGNNNNPGYISLTMAKSCAPNPCEYLCHSNCCYPYFHPAQTSDTEFKDDSSFYITKPLIDKPNYNSICVVKNENDKDVLYYLSLDGRLAWSPVPSPKSTAPRQSWTRMVTSLTSG